jgi:hypothetical protein
MAEQVVFQRLKKLVAKGYAIRWEGSEHTLHLEHPRAPVLSLFPDGRVWVLTRPPDDWVGPDNSVEQRFQSFVAPDDWIAVDNDADHRRFKAFLARVPKPTTLQALKAMTVEDVWIRVIVWTLIAVIALVGALLGAWLWRHLAGD